MADTSSWPALEAMAAALQRQAAPDDPPTPQRSAEAAQPRDAKLDRRLVRAVVEQVLERLRHRPYIPEMVKQDAQDISKDVRCRLQRLCGETYKFTVDVLVQQKHPLLSCGTTSRTYADAQRDVAVVAHIQNETLHCTCTVAGLHFPSALESPRR